MAPCRHLRLAVGLAALAGAVPGGDRVVLEPGASAAETPRTSGLQGWRLGTPAGPEDVVHPMFMLRHDPQNLRRLEQTLWDVSTPGTPRYGEHLTRTEAAAALPPLPGAEEVVLEWLAAHGVRDGEISISASRDIIEARVPVQTAQKMFATSFRRFELESTGAEVIRAVEPYSVPVHIADKLYIVGDLAELPSVRSARYVGTAGLDSDSPEEDAPGVAWPMDCGRSCRSSVTPAVLRQAYSLQGDWAVPVASTKGPSAGGMAVAEFQGVSYDKGDLAHFQKTCQLNNITVDRQVGLNAGLTCKVPLIGGELCTEALLDVEYIKAVAQDVPLTGISNRRYSLLKWAKQLDDLDDVPLVHSVSYGNDEVQQTSAAYMDAVNAQFMKLGTRGISILFASGDQGVYGRTGPTRNGRFHPDFPASSPYVTAVGGTDFAKKSTIGAERAWQDGGGGFSDNFAIPPYQREAVSLYKSAAAAAGVLPPQAHWNASGRGYPDVAALGGQQNPYCIAASIFVVSQMMGVAGTSASCPVVAGMFARLNELRRLSGMPPLGFLNPFIYKHGAAFNDVQLGNNRGAGREGFEALPGWDPATGMGTPNFERLTKAALAASPAKNIVV